MAYGAFDFTRQFRVSGPVFSMHIGGQHIDCYWSLALPFLLFANRLGTDAVRMKLVALLVTAKIPRSVRKDETRDFAGLNESH